MIEWLAWLPMLALIVAFGVYPQFLFKLFDPASENIVGHLKDYFVSR